MNNLLETHDAPVEGLRLVQDHRNTPTPGAFYDVLPPDAAFHLAQPFAPHDTPQKGSWLKMAESAVAALSKQCLDRRLPAFLSRREEVLMWADNRTRQRQTVHWKCSPKNARTKFKRHYANVQKIL